MTVKSSSRIHHRKCATGVMASVLTVATVGAAVATAPGAASAATNAELRSAAPPSEASPTVTGPVTGGNGKPELSATSFDLSTVGYTQSEYFLSGSATAYRAEGTLGPDGKWTAVPRSQAPYTTRIVVYRPADAKKFNGTVVVEWLNVSAGRDVAPDWLMAHNELIRKGYAWVGVSAQSVGQAATKKADPARYEKLTHPGDSYSYDIFSQTGQAVWKSPGTILSGLEPRKVLGAGESQSAIRLTTYVNAVHPLVNVFSGYLIHSRAGTAGPLSQLPEGEATPMPSVARTRNDLSVPVLTLQTETDVSPSGLAYLDSRQDDTDRFRLWEVAGTAHADTYTLNVGPTDIGDGKGSVALFNTMRNPPTGAGPDLTCGKPVNSGQQHYVLEAAFAGLNRWVVSGQAPPKAPRLQIVDKAFVLDANGNAKGGIRTPSVDTPVATLSGLGQPVGGSPFCRLFGTTVPLTAAQLTALYPTHQAFVAAWTSSTVKAVNAGFILPADAAPIIAAASTSRVPN